MLRFLFPGLTAARAQGRMLFDAITREARQPGWYREGAVPDTLEGRFSVLATVTALVLLRLENLGEDGDRLSVALTERFIEVMESEHREMGLGDPKLGRTVRKLVASLAGRLDRLRQASGSASEWGSAVTASLCRADSGASLPAWSAERLTRLRTKLESCTLEDLREGQFG